MTSLNSDVIPPYQLLKLAKHRKTDIPILLYNGDLRDGGKSVISKEEMGYFLISLKQKEFEEIEGTDLESVVRGTINSYKINNIPFPQSFLAQITKNGKVICMPPEEVLTRCIDEQWRYLEAFNIILKDRLHTLHLEGYQKISRTKVKS